MIKTTDIIASFLKSKGINKVYGVTGGAAVHLFDSFKKKNFEIIFTHHQHLLFVPIISKTIELQFVLLQLALVVLIL